MAELKAPNGATVTVDDSKVDNLLARGFTAPGGTKKAPAKKASSSKSSK